MKKTIWQPVLLGIAFGLLAGISITAGLSFVVSNSLTTGVIGFHVVLFLLSASIGGPLAGFITPTICVILIILFGDPEFVEFLSRPNIFWTNMIIPGMVMALTSFGYRLVFERVKMPARLLPWAGIVIICYFLQNSIIIPVQYYFGGDDFATLSSAILSAFQAYIPQAIFDIFITSLIFIALPSRYLRPLWYERQSKSDVP